MLSSPCGARSYGRHRRFKEGASRECESAKTNPLRAARAVVPRLCEGPPRSDSNARRARAFALSEAKGLRAAIWLDSEAEKQTHLTSQTQGVFREKGRRTAAPPSASRRLSPRALSTHSRGLLVKTRCLWSSVGTKKQSHYVEQFRGFSVARKLSAKMLIPASPSRYRHCVDRGDWGGGAAGFSLPPAELARRLGTIRENHAAHTGPRRIAARIWMTPEAIGRRPSAWGG
jgi:hypothetical protein